MSEAVRTILEADGAAAKGPGREAEAGFLWDFWDPAARSGEIRGNRLVTAAVVEGPLDLGRAWEGEGFAIRVSCPYRAVLLSYRLFDVKPVERGDLVLVFSDCTARCMAD